MIATLQQGLTESCILLVEDDSEIRELIVSQLQREPYRLLATGSVAEATSLLGADAVDLVILDLNLPDGDGMDFCKQLRLGNDSIAIIMVTARDAALDRVLGLELGADDYLTKPFEPRELKARIRGLLRRSRSTRSASSREFGIVRFGAWRLDLTQRRLIASDGRLVMLSAAEFKLLRRFLNAPNKVLSREELLPERGATVAFDRSLDLQISRLRQRLSTEPGGESVILTVRNEGYVMAGPVQFE